MDEPAIIVNDTTASTTAPTSRLVPRWVPLCLPLSEHELHDYLNLVLLLMHIDYATDSLMSDKDDDWGIFLSGGLSAYASMLISLLYTYCRKETIQYLLLNKYGCAHAGHV
jgi:hypothetical protein